MGAICDLLYNGGSARHIEDDQVSNDNMALDAFFDTLGVSDAHDAEAMSTGFEAFIKTFSTINVTTLHPDSRRKNDTLPNGNSRSEASSFLFRCVTCTFATTHREKLGYHEMACTGQSESQRDCPKTNAKVYTCNQCPVTYKTKTAMDAHIRSHSYQPTRCGEPSCASMAPFPTSKEFDKHPKDSHPFQFPAWCPQACQFPNCESTFVFHKHTSYTSHLRDQYGFGGSIRRKPSTLQGCLPKIVELKMPMSLRGSPKLDGILTRCQKRRHQTHLNLCKAGICPWICWRNSVVFLRSLILTGRFGPLTMRRKIGSANHYI